MSPISLWYGQKMTSLHAPVNSTVISDHSAQSLNGTEPTEIDRDPIAHITWSNALTPRPYQVEGIAYLRTHKRRWICDAPGLGKMLQCAYAAKPPVLVACPGYLTGTWYEWLVKYGNPEWRIIRVGDGTRAERQALLNTPADFHIINIEMLQRRKARTSTTLLEYKFRTYTTLIVDEAHHLRGRNASQSKRALEVADGCEYVFLATASPTYNTAPDLFMQFRILNPSEFTSYWEFAARYCQVIETPWGPKIIGVKPWVRKSGSLRRLFEKYSITRSYKQVGMQLPKLQEIDIQITLAPDAKARYDTLRSTFRDKLTGTWHDNLMSVLHTLRKQTASSKLPSLLELLTDTDALTGTMIFTHYKETAYNLAALLKCPAITGDMTSQERTKCVNSEQLLVATIDSVSEGMDASHLHTVVFFEESHIPGQMYQALSRVRRFGQAAEMVRAYHIFAKHTIDEIVHKTDAHKVQDIRAIVVEALA